MVWNAVTGEPEIPADASERIIEHQLYYFHNSPEDAYASPIWHCDLIPLRHDGSSSTLRSMRQQSCDTPFLPLNGCCRRHIASGSS
jgi:hypothetical protein